LPLIVLLKKGASMVLATKEDTSIQTPDADAITYKFDWYADHSSWRLDDIADDISEALTLLKNNSIDVTYENNFDSVRAIHKQLKALYLNPAISDSDVRKSLLLADSLFLSEEIESFDATDSYHDLTSMLEEELLQWQKKHFWVFSDEAWDCDLVKEFTNQQNHRNGLGERWSLKIEKDSVELPDGTLYRGVNPSSLLKLAMEALIEDDWYESEFPGIVDALQKLDETQLEKVHQLAIHISTCRVLNSRITEVDAIINACNKVDIGKFPEYLETISCLALNWSGDNIDLLKASLELT